jgi:hypothetical protein
LLRNFPKNVEDIDLDPKTGTTSLDLDPTIATGQSISEFVKKAAFDQEQRNLNKNSFRRLFAKMTDNYRIVLQQLRRRMANTGVHADVTHGNAQAIDKSFDFRFLKGNSVDFCKDVHPTVAGSKSFFGINSGGGSGIPYVAPLVAPQQNIFSGPPVFFVVGQLEPRIDGFLRAYGKENFQPDRSILDVIDPEILLAEQIDLPDVSVNLCISRFDIRDLEVVGEEYHGRADLGYLVFVTYRNREIPVRDLGGSLQFSFPRFHIVSTRDGNIDSDRVGTLVSGVMGQVHAKLPSILVARYNRNSIEGLTFVDHLVASRLFLAQNDLRASIKLTEQSEAVETARRQLQMLATVGLNSRLASVNQFVAKLEPSRFLPTVDEVVDRIVMRGHSIDSELENVDIAERNFEADLDKLGETPNLAPPMDALDTRIAQLEFIKDLRVAQWKQQGARPIPARRQRRGPF